MIEINGTEYSKDADGFYWRDGKKYDERGILRYVKLKNWLNLIL
jgi:hypothetical protein